MNALTDRSMGHDGSAPGGRPTPAAYRAALDARTGR